jgi:DNA-directed RNA polymerase specialized sigma24 family protein
MSNISGCEVLERAYSQYNKLHEVAYRVLRNYEDAEDAVGAAMLNMHLKSASYDSDRDILPWAIRFTHFAARNLAKRHYRHDLGWYQLTTRQAGIYQPSYFWDGD